MASSAAALFVVLSVLDRDKNGADSWDNKLRSWDTAEVKGV
jgi:hypothetical protein